MFKLLRKFITIVVVFVLGAAAGGFVMTKVQPRSFLNIKNCENTCFKQNELLGLLGSVGIQFAPDAIPGIVMETDKTIVVKHPNPATPVHYVIIPKKDIKNIGTLEPGDEAYIEDAVKVIGELIRRDNLTSYRVITNGPGYQSVAYLHFHLMGK
jgi:histidine triad (HIT) family protein